MILYRILGVLCALIVGFNLLYPVADVLTPGAALVICAILQWAIIAGGSLGTIVFFRLKAVDLGG